MKITSKDVRKLIQEEIKYVLLEQRINEMDISELSDVCFVGGSTHELSTCKIGNGNFYLKFSDSWDFRNKIDKSLQIGVEYLAYKIYQLYPESNVPQDIHIVSDPNKGRIGIATQAMKGEPGGKLRYKFPAHKWVKSISAGAMVDIFLANWDVANTNNFVVDQETGEVSKIDFGAALTFRAQGARKGSRFSGKAGELDTMLDKEMEGGAGWLLSQVDMKKACESFLSVSWQQVVQAIEEAKVEVAKELQSAGLEEEIVEWGRECEEIKQKLQTRHVDVTEHCKYALQQM